MDDDPLLVFPDRASARRRFAALLAGLVLGVGAAVGGAVAYGPVVGGRVPRWPQAYTVRVCGVGWGKKRDRDGVREAQKRSAWPSRQPTCLPSPGVVQHLLPCDSHDRDANASVSVEGRGKAHRESAQACRRPFWCRLGRAQNGAPSLHTFSHTTIHPHHPHSYNLVAYRNEAAGLQKVVRDGVETSFESLPHNTLYHRQPRVDTYFCEAMDMGGGKGPTSARGGGGGRGWAVGGVKNDDDTPTLTPVLPDMTAPGWAATASARRADGSAGPPGARAYVRAFTVDGGTGNGEYASKFTLWVTGPHSAPVPLLLEALAVNMWTGGHYDLTVAHFSDYTPGPPPRDRLKVPKGCPLKPSVSLLTASPRLPTDLLASALPNPHAGDGEYDAFLHRHGGGGGASPAVRRTRTRSEYKRRAAAHAASAARVAAHNARPHTGYTLAMTRFADYLPHERRALVSQHPRAAADGVPTPREGDAFYEPPRAAPLPATVDWRGSPADSSVKDQAMCGSCWAFGTIGAGETALFRATGKPLLLSEQHLLDCAWSPPSYTGKYPNAGCGGGYQTTAFDWWFARGGAVAAADYPYRGAPGFCDTKVKDAVSFTGRYVWVKGGVDGLRSALVAKGPMTVSVDASSDDFALYQSGVYNNTKCEQALKRLDHAVLISGYGVDPETGTNFLFMKNTWGPLWGERGYMRITAPPNDDCGISTQPLFLELENVKRVD